VRLEHHAGLRPDRFSVVAKMRAVGGADLAQATSRARHDLGQAERAADLHKLAT
jgi:hypothetical protein